MRLRFSIRDLLWLTLVVAMGLTWWINSQRSRAELEQTQGRLAKWRGATGALEHVLKMEGAVLDWALDPSSVIVIRRYDYGGSSWRIEFTDYEPSREDR